jgi:hypothetical protein
MAWQPLQLANGQRPAGRISHNGRSDSISFIALLRLASAACSFSGKAYRRLQGRQGQQFAAGCSWVSIAASAGVIAVLVS